MIDFCHTMEASIPTINHFKRLVFGYHTILLELLGNIFQHTFVESCYDLTLGHEHDETSLWLMDSSIHQKSRNIYCCIKTTLGFIPIDNTKNGGIIRPIGAFGGK
jgi:hypothetical protein